MKRPDAIDTYEADGEAIGIIAIADVIKFWNH